MMNRKLNNINTAIADIERKISKLVHRKDELTAQRDEEMNTVTPDPDIQSRERADQHNAATTEPVDNMFESEQEQEVAVTTDAEDVELNNNSKATTEDNTVQLGWSGVSKDQIIDLTDFTRIQLSQKHSAQQVKEDLSVTIRRRGFTHYHLGKVPSDHAVVKIAEELGLLKS